MQGTIRKRGTSWQALLNVQDSQKGTRHQISSTHPTKAEAERWLTKTCAHYGFGEGAAHSMTVGELGIAEGTYDLVVIARDGATKDRVFRPGNPPQLRVVSTPATF